MAINSQHRITIDASQAEVFKAITTAEGLKGWYTPGAKGEPVHGNKVRLHFTTKEGPFEWNVVESKPGSTVRWECIAGPGSAIGTTATFHLVAKSDGRTTVDLDHAGLEESDDKVRICNTMWGALMHHLKKYVESKETDPAFH
jgi:uncharacterized protein YndB with AHSA1/START domain